MDKLILKIMPCTAYLINILQKKNIHENINKYTGTNISES